MFYKSKTKKQEEIKEQNRIAVEAFLSDYREIAQKHGIDFSLELNITTKGIFPIAKPFKINVEDKPKVDIK